MIELDNRTSINFDINVLERIAHVLTKKEIELIITRNEEMREINRDHRNIDKDNDVLNYTYKDRTMNTLRKIVISSSYVNDK